MIHELINSKQVWLVTNGTTEQGKRLIRELSEAGHAVVELEANPRKEAAVQQEIERILDGFGTIDVVVNNPGKDGKDIDLFGALNVIRRVMPHFRAKQGGMIFNIAPVSDARGASTNPDTGGFSPANTDWGHQVAIAGLTESLAQDITATGIRLSAVYSCNREGLCSFLMHTAQDPAPPLHLFTTDHPNSIGELAPWLRLQHAIS